MAELKDQQKVWAKIVAKAWADEDYKQRLLDDPATVLKAEGAELPEGVAFKCVEATESQAWLVLPPKPTDAGSVEVGMERLAAWYMCGYPTCV
jgi:nitrile hydratase